MHTPAVQERFCLNMLHSVLKVPREQASYNLICSKFVWKKL